MKRLKLLEKRQRAGIKGGQSRSPAKLKAVRENMTKARRKANALKHGYKPPQMTGFTCSYGKLD